MQSKDTVDIERVDYLKEKLRHHKKWKQAVLSSPVVSIVTYRRVLSEIKTVVDQLRKEGVHVSP